MKIEMQGFQTPDGETLQGYVFTSEEDITKETEDLLEKYKWKKKGSCWLNLHKGNAMVTCATLGFKIHYPEIALVWSLSEEDLAECET